jgi:hypothetical protein
MKITFNFNFTLYLLFVYLLTNIKLYINGLVTNSGTRTVDISFPFFLEKKLKKQNDHLSCSFLC